MSGHEALEKRKTSVGGALVKSPWWRRPFAVTAIEGSLDNASPPASQAVSAPSAESASNAGWTVLLACWMLDSISRGELIRYSW